MLKAFKIKGLRKRHPGSNPPLPISKQCLERGAVLCMNEIIQNKEKSLKISLNFINQNFVKVLQLYFICAIISFVKHESIRNVVYDRSRKNE